MTRRLTNASKKKLEASLENLTARQSGRLFLIYSNEYFTKETGGGVWEYPPIVDLKNAWEKRITAAKSKGGQIEEEMVAAYNGFMALTNLIREANRIADSDLWRLYALALAHGNQIDSLMAKDSQSELFRVTVNQFTGGSPRPLTWEDYNKAAAWYEGYATIDLEELSNELTGDYSSRQGYELLEVPEEFLEAISTPEIDYGSEDEDIRRKWVKQEGEDLVLSKHFAGDQDRFEAWKKHGGSPKFNGREWDTMADEILDRLIDMVKSGKAEGGLCIGLENHWEFTPVLGWDRANPDDTSRLYVPAWNALRSIWISWLYDKGIFRGDEKRVEEDFPDYLETFYDVDGTLEVDRMTVKAKEFYLDCQKKPWGSGLIAPEGIDFAFLGRFLCAEASPLLGYYAPDLGTVNVGEFHEAEGNDPFMGPSDKAGEAWYYATLRGLKNIEDELKIDSVSYGHNFVREFYYPTDDPERIRITISNLIRRMSQLRVSHRPFTYKEKNKRELSSFLGMEFYTPLEIAIREFGEVFDDIDTFKLTYALLSQEFFDGIPILSPLLQDRLKGVEEALKVTEDILNQWIELLSTDFWNVDTTSLRLVKKGPDDDFARIMVGATVLSIDNDHDNKRFPTWLDGGETFESITQKITGLDYAGITKTAMKGRIGGKK